MGVDRGCERGGGRLADPTVCPARLLLGSPPSPQYLCFLLWNHLGYGSHFPMHPTLLPHFPHTQALTSDPANVVCLFSGRSNAELSDWFAAVVRTEGEGGGFRVQQLSCLLSSPDPLLLQPHSKSPRSLSPHSPSSPPPHVSPDQPNLGLVAENGYYLRPGGSSSWESLVPQAGRGGREGGCVDVGGRGGKVWTLQTSQNFPGTASSTGYMNCICITIFTQIVASGETQYISLPPSLPPSPYIWWKLNASPLPPPLQQTLAGRRWPSPSCRHMR